MNYAIELYALFYCGIPVLTSLIVLLLKKPVSLVLLLGPLLLFIVTFTDQTHLIGGNFLLVENVINNIDLSFTLDVFGYQFIKIIGLLWLPVTLYSLSYFKKYNIYKAHRFFIFTPICISLSLAIALSGNLLTMFFFYELLTFASYPLVSLEGTDDAIKSGSKYVTLLAGSSVSLFLPAIVIVANQYNNLNFIPHINNGLSGVYMLIIMIMFLYGIAKSAIFPLHGWLPIAMVAPAPVSALLHAVAIVKSGIFCLVKVYFYFFLHSDNLKNQNNHITAICCFSCIIASVFALRSTKVKKILAYSTVSQLAYMSISISLLTIGEFKATMFCMMAHSFAKITLFLCTGSMQQKMNVYDIHDLNGIIKYMPITSIFFIIGALSMIGIPLTASMWAKEYIITYAPLEKSFFISTILVISTVLNVMYFMPLILRIIFSKTSSRKKIQTCEADSYMLLSYSFTITMVVIMFFIPKMFILKLIN
ncbi:MAG: NADH dehydrogenase [Candidatus Xenolissoclinum pacificiensis L6]|uniref:NADH dehydrogenase n=1 Tax=Candidatus Xenolissoclinum pacificiensis L6 TaxID=1401685 RepID=W2V0S7_9RICK|nr:MAG: NADH dehydrogenase [Candidatus Xenolissoclinum pacificiensis L6]